MERKLINIIVTLEIAEIIVDYWAFIAKMMANYPFTIYPMMVNTQHAGMKIARLRRYQINYAVTRLIPSL